MKSSNSPSHFLCLSEAFLVSFYSLINLCYPQLLSDQVWSLVLKLNLLWRSWSQTPLFTVSYQYGFDCLLMFRVVFQFFWIISFWCLALDLADLGGAWSHCKYGGFWVGFYLLMFHGVRSSMMVQTSGVESLASGFRSPLTVTSRLLCPHSTEDKTPRLMVKQLFIARNA